MMIREQMEERELEYLSPYATLSKNSKGRKIKEEECDIRPVFQRDRDRIVHCKAFRRLKQKTQVFLLPKGDHYRTRLTHTLEVSQNARTIAKALRLNEELVEAIALGHDLGHTPFGHNGEAVLNSIHSDGFSHNVQSLRVVDVLESHNGMRGMNLTEEVRDGILNHTGKGVPFTLEGQIVKISDRIAYINHDIDDACRAGILTVEDIPSDLRKTLGDTHSKRINTLVTAVITASMDKPEISMTPEIGEAMDKLRDFLFESVYRNPIAKSQENKSKELLVRLFEYYVKNPEKMPDLYYRNTRDEQVERCVCDFISGMTDRYAIETYRELFIPEVWRGKC